MRNHEISPEYEFLRTLCLTGRAPETPTALNWCAVLELARRHRIEGLVASSLIGNPRFDPPAGVLSRLGELKKTKALTYLYQLAETLRVSTLLESRGITAIALKGCAVAETLYRPEPAARESIDIDLLVDTSNFAAADSFLRTEGYLCISPSFDVPHTAQSMLHFLLNAYEYVHHETGMKIELHHRLLNNPGILDVPFDRLLACTKEIPAGGGRIRGLTENVQVAFLSAHAAEHACFRLKWLADAARAFAAVSPADRPALLDDARTWRCERHLLTLAALTGNDTVTNAGEPDELGRAAQATAFCQKAMLAAETDTGHRLQDLPDDLRKLGFLLRLQSTFQNRLFPVIRLLTNVDDVRVLRLGRKWLPVYCLLGRPLAIGRLVRRTLAAFKTRLSGAMK